jgi:hypothetical protein
MQKALWAVAIVALVAFSGCSGKKKEEAKAFTCPDGTVLTPQQIEAFPDHHEATFNASSHCPVKPSVTLTGIPASLQSYKTAAFKASLDAGTSTPAHSMLLSVRWYDRSVADADLTNINKYPNELVKKEHQNLPVTYDMTMTFAKVGKVYVRAYMEQGGNDYWSKEYAIDITPVQPTGKTVAVTLDQTGKPSPDSVSVVLGDAVQVTSNYLGPDTCKWSSGPNGGPTDNFATAGMAPSSTSNAVVYTAPGVYVYQCQDPQSQGFKVNAAQP